MNAPRKAIRIVAVALLVASTIALLMAPVSAPTLVAIALATTAWPMTLAWRAARGTELRAALTWGALAVALGIVAQVVGRTELLATGRPAAGHWAYLSSLATLASTISVLNARKPGGGAWAILMGLLVLVFLIPWLEGSGLAREAPGVDRLRLRPPWTIFYVLVAIAGVTNYLPTRYGPASAWLGLGLGVLYAALIGLIDDPVGRSRVWSAVPLTIGWAIWTAEIISIRTPRLEPGLVTLWIWFRDRWGVVWALRVQERFNHSAARFNWPIRLGWAGIEAAGGEPEGEDWPPAVPEEAGPLLVGLLRRFADPRVLDAAADGHPEAL